MAPRSARPGRAPRVRVAVLAVACAAGCAHQEAAPARVDDDWIQPRLDEAARAALRCIRGEPDRVLEIEATADGKTRAFVLPYPARREQQACADEEAARLHLEPAQGSLRSLVDGGGRLVDPRGARQRGLALRARAIDQIAPVERCRQAFEARHPQASGRVGVLLSVAEDGAVASVEIPASTLDDEAGRCVGDAVRGLRLPAIPGTYRYSYLLAPRGVLVGAPDVDAVDPYDLSASLADIRARTDACLKGYRSPGRVIVHLDVGNDGVPIAGSVERANEGGYYDEDVAADACLKKAAAALRLLPFDGPPAKVAIPFTLR